MKKLIPLLVCFAFTDTASASTIFSCDLSNKHNVSIDSSNQLGLAYDYGKVDATKSDLTLDNKSASYGTYLGPSWSYQYFRFARGNYSYVVYDRDGRTQGLAVYQGKKLLINKKCTGNIEHDETGYTAASNQIKHDPDDNVLDFMPEDISPPADSSSQDQQQESQNQQAPSDQPVPKQAPVKLSINEKTSQYETLGSKMKVFTVISLVDDVVINDFIIDKGRCVNFKVKPFHLKFGRSYDWKYKKAAYMYSQGQWVESPTELANCPDLEIVVKTNQGDWTFTPNQ